MSENFATFLSTYPWIIVVVVLWTIPWKGVALWRAARNGSMVWFITLLIINTLGILEIIYIFFFSKKRFVSNNIRANGANNIERKILDIKRDQY